MTRSIAKGGLLVLLGAVLGAGAILLQPAQPVAATGSHGNDKFSMTTVPVSGINQTEVIFVLDHLTGVLRGSYLNPESGQFTHQYVYNVAADFQLNAATLEPKYAILGGPANFQAAGAAQPAAGALYIGELSSGAVIAYTFELPQGRGSNRPMGLARASFFNFREASR